MPKLADEILKQLRQFESGEKLLRVPMEHRVLKCYTDAEDALTGDISDAEVIGIISKLHADLKKINPKSIFTQHAALILQRIPAIQQLVLNQLQPPQPLSKNFEIIYQLMPPIDAKGIGQPPSLSPGSKEKENKPEDQSKAKKRR